MQPWHLAALLPSAIAILVIINFSLSNFWHRRDKAEQWLWAAVVTPTSFQLRVQGEGHLVVSPAAQPALHVFAQRLPGAGVHNVTVGGLQPDTEYRYGLVAEPLLEPLDYGRVKTWALGAQPSLRVGVASCATVGSNDPVFDEIADAKFDLFLHMGDLHYHNIEDNDRQLYLDAIAQVHGSPRQRRLFRSAPVAYVWDDHDFGSNDCNRLSPSARAARAVFQETVPKPEVPGSPLAAYHAFSVGRTRFVMLDTRSESLPGDSIMSEAQMDWLLQEIANPGPHKLLILMLGQPWIGAEKSGGDGWLGHVADRQRISNALANASAAGGYANVLGVAGDAHMLAFDDGTNTDYSTSGGAGFPLLHAAPLDRSGSAKGGPYTKECLAYKLADNHQFGSLEITDSGGGDASAICVRFKMHRGGGVVGEEHMCGPLLGSRNSASTSCSIPLMPPRQTALFVLVLLSFLTLLFLAVYWQQRGEGRQRRLGWLAAATAALSFLPQVALFLLEKKNELPLDPPWRPLLFQFLVQFLLLLVLGVLARSPWLLRSFQGDLTPIPKDGARQEMTTLADDKS